MEMNSLLEKVAALSKAIDTEHPTLKSLLTEIHATLLENPDQVTILKPEDISVIVNGLAVTKNEVLFTETKKKVASDKRKLKDMPLEDI
jgi:hypothetical protein